jgi:two-component system, NtrC family, sensor kinase
MTSMRVSIRFKMLLVISAVLLPTMSIYLYLATTLFARDKLAYIYDLNASLVDTLAEQTRVSLEVSIETVLLFARDVQRPGISWAQRQQLAKELFDRKQELVRIEIIEPDSHDGRPRYTFVNTATLIRQQLSTADLASLRRELPPPLESIMAAKGDVFIQNASLPPNAAILTLALATPDPTAAMVIVVDMIPERLLGIFGRSTLHETYLIDERGEILVHPDPKKIVGHYQLADQALVKQALAAKLNRGVREFSNSNGEAMLGAYARVGLGRLSVLAQIEKREALATSRKLIDRSLLFAGLILLAAFMASVLFSRLLTAPIRRLKRATEEIAKGNYNVDVAANAGDEIGDLSRAFIYMARSLKDTQFQLVQSEKLAAFGQLGAGITHEVQNPMTGIIGFAQLAQNKVTTDPDKTLQLLQTIEKEGLRCKEILSNFLRFARGDSDVAMQPLDMNQVVRDAARVFAHTLGMHKVKTQLKLAEKGLTIMGNANQIQQVLLNLAINAQQAMPGGGNVNVSTELASDGHVLCTVADDGPGIPEEIRDKVFDPFVTTKPVGQGTGLGLAICHRIVHDHHGTITVGSQSGKGAIFVIRLPVVEATEIEKQADGMVALR